MVRLGIICVQIEDQKGLDGALPPLGKLCISRVVDDDDGGFI